MPTIVGHAVFGATLARLRLSGVADGAGAGRTLALCGAAAMLPDLDVVTFKLGIPYASPWGHRGFSHSLFFAAAAALVLLWLSHGLWPRLGFSLRAGFVLLFGVIASHALLDMFTDATHGPALFMPFSPQRFLFDWRPIEGSPITPRFWMTAKGWRVVWTEALYIGLPCLALMLACRWRERRKDCAA